MPRFPTRAVTGAIAAVVVVAMPPDRRGWSTVVTAAGTGGRPPRLDDVAALLAGTALWCLAGWVVLALAAGRLAALPGACGAAGRLLVRVFVPRVLRGVVVGGVAGGLLLGPAVAAVATPVWPTSPAAGVSVGATPGPAWPTDAPAPAETTSPPATTPPPAPMPAAPTTGAASVVVAPGDSLWSIAAGGLAHGGRTPTDTQVAAAWPSWFAANRAAIGPDPGLLQPGTRLSAPAPTDGSSP